MLKAGKNKKNMLWAAIIVVLLIFLHFVKVLVPVESIVVKATKPVLSRLYQASFYFRRIYSEETDKRNLAEENKSLEAKVNDLITESAKAKALEEENASLRQYLNFLNTAQTRYVMADVISLSSMNSEGVGQSITINKGAKDGLVKDLAVVNNQGIIIGKITNVKDNIAEANLTTNDQCKLAATIQNQDKTGGIAEGALGLTIKMNFIPQTKTVNSGDIVVTSGLERTIPRGLVIGSVVSVAKENNELWQSATIEPLLDADKLDLVSVLLPN